MTDFAQVSDPWKGLLGLSALLGLLMLLHDLLRCVQLGRKRVVLPAGLLLLLSFIHLQLMIMNAFRNPFYPLGIHLKLIPTAAVCLGTIFLSAYLGGRIGRWSKSHITAMSVKEAFDRLPAGLCYYLPCGLIRLVNARMNELCLEALGEPLMDPAGFWKALEQGELSASLRGGEAPMLAFPDGRIYSFRRRTLQTELGAVEEILAADVSRDWALNRELELKQERARELNTRLRALLGSMEYVTMSRELMELKSVLHDQLGQSLLLSRRCLLEPDSVDPGEARNTWLKNLRMLENSRPESWQKPYYLPIKQAEALGVHLEIRGDLPAESRLIPAVETALIVHSTNVLRHAGGSRAVVTCTREAGEYLLQLTNDGAVPGGEIREAGGLANLRSRVEALGGRMEIEASPVFRLSLRLPADGGEQEEKPCPTAL